MKTVEELLNEGFVALDCIENVATKTGSPLYYINRVGDIYSLRAKRILGKLPHTLGYMQTYLTNFAGGGRWYKLHRLVALQFISNPQKLTDVNHINGIKTDNRVENLEWLSHSDNIKHSFRVLGRKHTATYAYKKVKCSNGKTYESLKAAAEATGCHIPNISACLNGKMKHTKKLTFTFA